MKNPSHPSRTIAYRQIIELSHVIDPQMPHWPGDPSTRYKPHAAIASDGFYLRQVTIGEHSGTHMNAANTFDEAAAGIDDYSASQLVLPMVVIDVRDRAAADADYGLTIADLQAWETENGAIALGSLVALWTGWQAKWPDPIAFLNQDDRGQLHFPGFGEVATRFLLAERAIAGVGIDTHGVDPGCADAFTTNQLVLAAGGIVLENLTNLDHLPPQGTTIAIGRLPLRGGSGSPVSVLAFVP
ncbi:MAG: cyclase family protein [Oscillatoriales cyanobacterium]|nr:MAG: cyclase family protein [Oscillatoriales cyanobacterium]